jgi:Arginine/lysine/ornithine decarboxylases
MTQEEFPATAVPAAPSISDYYNASQLRADSWNRLKACTARLAIGVSARAAAKLKKQTTELFQLIELIESYWAFPGRVVFHDLRRQFEANDYEAVASNMARITRSLMSNSYRRHAISLGVHLDQGEEADELFQTRDDQAYSRPYFEVLFVDNIPPQQEHGMRQGLFEMRRNEDRFIYEPVFVPSLEDALIAILFNYNIQAVVIRYGFPLRSRHNLELLLRYVTRFGKTEFEELAPEDYGTTLASLINKCRPELDIYLVTDQSVEEIADKIGQCCRRLFYNQEDYLELHLNILRGINERFETPFFSALREYSKQPAGVFHALPISRGKSIAKSNWIKDMGEFYGKNIFLAETSATSGGLDSLLDPKGAIREAHEKAARAFGARQTFFATNGTSTCNKIVVQAIVQPGDIVLVDRDCHKSHHYGMVLSGAEVLYLDAYPLSPYSMYGGVPIREIKRQLLQLRRAGKLDRVKMLLLTYYTFDGIVYHVERFMEECLAIKPDLVFLWDEAWFGFARFSPTYRKRTSMQAARTLRERYQSDAYRQRYASYAAETSQLDPDDDAA